MVLLNKIRFNTVRALARLERRTAEVVYARKKWYHWVKETQDKEDAERESEKKMIQREAALYKRHWKELESRLKATRQKENKKKQDEYLEQAYLERMSDDDESTWDPIEDSVEDERAPFHDMIAHLLWLEDFPHDPLDQHETASAQEEPAGSSISTGKENVEPDTSKVMAVKTDGTPRSKNARKKARQSVNKAQKQASSESSAEATVNVNESKESLRERLLNGGEYDYKAGMRKYSLLDRGFQMGGTLDNSNEVSMRLTLYQPLFLLSRMTDAWKDCANPCRRSRSVSWRHS